jgi:FkbM family methyltransferase
MTHYLFGYTIRLYPDAHQTRQLVYYTNQADYDTIGFVQRYLQPGDHFIDAGANIGLYTLLAASQIGKSGHLYAFEPCPKTVARLQENLSDNQLDWVRFHAIALGETDTTIALTTDLDTINHIFSEDDHNQSTVHVPCQRLDHVVDPSLTYAIAKLDVEGFELPLLKGAYNLLANHQIEVLILEINGASHRYGISAEDIVSYLKSLGYTSFSYQFDTNQLTPIDNGWDDVLFISDRHLEKVRSRLHPSNYSSQIDGSQTAAECAAD